MKSTAPKATGVRTATMLASAKTTITFATRPSDVYAGPDTQVKLSTLIMLFELKAFL